MTLKGGVRVGKRERESETDGGQKNRDPTAEKNGIGAVSFLGVIAVLFYFFYHQNFLGNHNTDNKPGSFAEADLVYKKHSNKHSSLRLGTRAANRHTVRICLLNKQRRGQKWQRSTFHVNNTRPLSSLAFFQVRLALLISACRKLR